MKSGLRKSAYMISALAIAWFFLFPLPNVALIGALLLQTLAYVVIAGKSFPDGMVLTGITVLLIGSLPGDHPLIRGEYYQDIRLWIIAVGIAVLCLGLLLLYRRIARYE